MKNSTLITAFVLLGLFSCEKYSDRNSIELPQTSAKTELAPEENPFIKTMDESVSTFSIDADGASYAIMRRYILQLNQLPPREAIRTEELLNYFDLNYETNTEDPITLNGEISTCPWNVDHKLIRIGIKGKQIPNENLPASNYVFLIDVSGSMGAEDKLTLLKNGFKSFVETLNENDKVAFVTYAGAAQLLLPSTPGSEKNKINEAINQLGSGGGTAGAQGIITAYEIAQTNMIEDGNNRVILGTDGDFNIGVSSTEELVKLIEEKRNLGIFLTVVGVGLDNLNDGMMEQIADKGNGNFEYLDNPEQLKKVFVYEKSKFYTVAKDVKVQVEFNPEIVESYRLIGYENRLLKQADFTNDKKDAGEIGSNQNITALYEIVLKNEFDISKPSLKIDFRYKNPKSNESIPLSLELYDTKKSFEQSTDFMKFSASIASYSMLITNSAYKGKSSYDNILSWLNSTHLEDKYGFKTEFKQIVERAKGY